eukprot:1155039-Pelagomonas_calceolata.AAC.2
MAGRERRQVQQQGRASSKLKDWRSRPSASRVKHRQPANQGKPCPAVISKKLSRVWVGMSILPMPLINIENSRGSGIGLLRSIKIGQMLHAHSVQYAHKLSSSRYAIENKYTHHDLEPRNARSPPDQHQLHAYLPLKLASQYVPETSSGHMLSIAMTTRQFTRSTKTFSKCANHCMPCTSLALALLSLGACSLEPEPLPLLLPPLPRLGAVGSANSSVAMAAQQHP